MRDLVSVPQAGLFLLKPIIFTSFCLLVCFRCFSPASGIIFIETIKQDIKGNDGKYCFSPASGIIFIETTRYSIVSLIPLPVSVPQAGLFLLKLCRLKA